MKKKHISSAHIIPMSFLAAIIIGTILLMLPVSASDGKVTDLLTALFTATTSVCVTGLVVVDTYSHWSMFGQIVILILAQIGGLGIVTVASMFMLITRKKFSIADRLMLKDALNLNTGAGILRVLIRIFVGTLVVEMIGACLYAIRFIPQFGYGKGIWTSIFNSVSAFCNAGMDVIGANSLGDYSSDPLILGVTMVLIVLGGLGYVVWFDTADIFKKGVKNRFSPIQMWKRFSEHTKLVLSMSLFLIILGAVAVFAAECHNPATIGNMSFGDKVLNSLFQSITFRTAGFSSVSQKGLTSISCVTGYILMFIGGSPVGTAGGIKTVTFFLAVMNVVFYIRGDDKNVVFKRRVTEDMMRKASVIMSVSVFTVIVLTLLIMATNPSLRIDDVLYEVISASATVGLTRNLTTSLNAAGRVIIIIAMYLGRIGPISMAIFFAKRDNKKTASKYAVGEFYVG